MPPIADYHFHVERVKRSAGRSVVAAAAYRAGETLRDDYYGTTRGFKKPDVVKTGIFLPSHAPPRFADRETLWNEVERVEKHPSAQLAYSFDFSLQNEFTMEENIALAEQFIREQFVARGMICDYAIHNPHPDEEVQNPHVHVLCPIRPLNGDGTWGAKQKRAYKLDEGGNRIRDANGRCVFKPAYTTVWDAPETLEAWRQAWADLCNAKFEEKGLDCRIDNRSYKRQGLDLIPTTHEGPAVREMEKRGVRTRRGSLNRWIRETNRKFRGLLQKLKELKAWIAEEKAKQAEPTLIDLIDDYYHARNTGAYSRKARDKNFQDFVKAANFLAAHNLRTMDDLDARVDELTDRTAAYKNATDERSARIKKLRSNITLAELYIKNKPIHVELNGIKFKKRREAFQLEHQRELDNYYMARRKLKDELADKHDIPLAAWRKELRQLEAEAENDPAREEYRQIKQELDQLWNVRRCAGVALRDRELTPEQRLQKQAEAMQHKNHNR